MSGKASKTGPAIWIVAAAAVYMSLVGLGNVDFWDDEVETAWMSKSIVENGRPVAWNGRNIHDYGSGLYLNERIENTFPPATFLAGALSFRMFGVSEGGGRTLFALMGVACLGIFLLLLRREVPDGGVRLAAFALFSLSPVYLLHIRNMRYYAPALLFTLAAFYFHRLYVTRHRPENVFPWSVWAAAACAGLLFFTHFVVALSFIIGLGICHLIFHAQWKKPEWNLWLALSALTTVCALYLFSVGYITPDFEIRTNVFSIFYQEQDRLARISSLLPLYLRFINIGGLAPWFVVVWIVWLAAKRLARKGAEGERTPLFYGSLGLLITVSCAVISPQQEYDQYAATRFFFIAFPFFAVATAFFCLKIHAKSRVAGIALILLILNTTVVTWPFGIQNSPPLGRNYRFTDLPAPVARSVNIFSFESTYAQFPLPAMALEFHRDYPTFIDGLTEFFKTNGKQDEIIAVYPTWSYYNTMWYLDKKFLFCCVHSRAHALPPEVLRKHGVDIRMDTTPDWLLLFGPALAETPGRILSYPASGDIPVGGRVTFRLGGGAPYVLVKKLNALFFPVWRPELFWHSFSPVEVSEDPRRGDVFIFRREKRP